MENQNPNFANHLSAAMSKQTEDEYVQSMESLLNQIDLLEHKANELEVKTLPDFREGMALKSALSSLFCYTANNKKDTFDRVSDIENIVGKKLFRFAKRFRKPLPCDRILAHYLLWSRRYINLDEHAILSELVRADMLRKDEGKYYIIGLHYAVGDNTFGVGRNGQQYRLYVGCCALQAIGISFCSERLRDLDTLPVPQLEKVYTKYWVGNYKGGIKISFSYKERQHIREHYRRN